MNKFRVLALLFGFLFANSMCFADPLNIGLNTFSGSVRNSNAGFSFDLPSDYLITDWTLTISNVSWKLPHCSPEWDYWSSGWEISGRFMLTLPGVDPMPIESIAGQRTSLFHVVSEDSFQIVPYWIPHNGETPQSGEMQPLPGHFDVYFGGYAVNPGAANPGEPPLPGCCNNFIQYDLSMNLHVAPIIPEPSSMTLLGIGVLSLIGCGWRRKR